MQQFMGYRRANGDVGARNHLLILSGTVYANSVVERVAETIHGAVPITHANGRCQVAPDLRVTRRFLAGTAMNPNVGAVVIIDHFKEEGMTAEDLADDIAPTGKPIATVNIRGEGGYINALAKATRYAQGFARQISLLQREPAPISKILFGTECGTSDTTSGLASNPANGLAGELLIAQGGRMLMAECTEWMGCENWLTDKAASPEVAAAIIAGVQHMEARALASGEDIRGSQPTGDNMAGGLTTIEEKSMGAVKKIGDSPIIEHLDIAAVPTRTTPGNYVMYGPGMGAESISSMAAAGCQVLTFCTGGGHTSNHPIMPTIKVTGNRNSYDLMRDTVDVDVSGVFTGELTLAEAGQIIYDEMARVCSGYLTKSEALRDNNSFAIHRVGPSI
ncbi:MAG: UxaA family hydrolase [Chloroflexi bacterium]|nr:UxaA family hydrolase [Chloroflexota bacterium]MCY3582289.1 UxaA family hydrolase [Chloroflexota bacterium]MCY3717269.1 UxaA family hydrolase [Chloroflexota bacterium]MDE2651746.1 UxaA family hydrolase [Chloroflexota bacterium]MXV93621.1 UxaA family hydrolase [Chloroflexota bacterium]